VGGKEKRKGGKIFVVALRRLKKEVLALHQPVVLVDVASTPVISISIYSWSV